GDQAAQAGDQAAQAGDQAAQAQLANQTQLTQSLAAKYQRAFTRQALLKLSSH
ncbi:hypothetical protein IAL74_02610, partial [Limosilactobacillus fermentum]|nr:hypothetical protein [Limosilactobacillus fermentum]